MKNFSALIDESITDTIIRYQAEPRVKEITNSFEQLISMGELVDRLSIVNFKLYNLKDEVMNCNQDDETFKAWASVQDVKLVMERARLKKCIDEKLITMINRIKAGDLNAGFNAEVKKYGDE